MSMLFWYNLLTLDNTDGLYCTSFDADNFRCYGNHYTFGAAADSMYEYMLKQWVMTNGTDEVRTRGFTNVYLGIGIDGWVRGGAGW